MKTNDNDARRIFHANLSRFMALRGIEQSDIVSLLGVSSATASDWYSIWYSVWYSLGTFTNF